MMLASCLRRVSALFSLVSTAFAEEILSFDPSAGVSMGAGWVDSS